MFNGAASLHRGCPVGGLDIESDVAAGSIPRLPRAFERWGKGLEVGKLGQMDPHISGINERSFFHSVR